MLKKQDKRFWTNGKFTVYLNVRKNIKVLRHDDSKVFDYFSTGLYGSNYNNRESIVPKSVLQKCRELHKYIAPGPSAIYTEEWIFSKYNKTEVK